MNKKLIIIIGFLLVLFAACAEKKHIDETKEYDVTNGEFFDKLELLGGYTVAEKHLSYSSIQNPIFFFFIMKTEDYNHWKATGEGLLAQGKKGYTVKVKVDVFNSVNIGDAIPVIVEKEDQKE